MSAQSWSIINGFFETRAMNRYASCFLPSEMLGRFWRNLQLKDGVIRATNQVIGKNMLNSIPKKIAEVLNLNEAEKFTGQAFRGTALTIMADKGASEDQMRRVSGHKSSSAVQKYIANSLNSKEIGAKFLTISTEESAAINQESSSSGHGTVVQPGVTTIINVYGGGIFNDNRKN